MASPTSSPPFLGPDSDSPIENEIPTYRAISPMSVASLGLGLISALSFTSSLWVAAAALAVLFGVISIRMMNRFPDAWTGRSFAQAGIAMGLVFGLSSQAYSFWSTRILYADAQTFAEKFNETLIAAQKIDPIDTSDVVWYMIPSAQRRGITPEDAKARLSSVLKSSEKVKNTDDNLRAMITHAKGVPIELVEVENAVYLDLEAYASVLFQVGALAEDKHEHKAGEVHNKEDERGKSYALVRFKGTGGRSNPNRWHVDDIRYPYLPRTDAPPVAKPGGDHGHDH